MARRKVLLIGSNGQLGSDILEALASDPRYAATPLTHSQIEVCDRDSVSAAVRAARPDIVVNTAAFHHLDRCEEDPQKAFAVNATAVRLLCEACAECGATLAHFSTDYVFGGGKQVPYLETDPAWPVNVYGISKLAGEAILRSALERHYTLRVSGLYGKRGPSGKGLNFPDLMVKLARERGEVHVVDDQVTTPTATSNVARRLLELFDRVPYGTYHFSDEGDCSWFRFAGEVLEAAGIRARITPVKTGYFGEKTRRPGYSVLSKQAILEHLPASLFPRWEESIRAYLSGKGHPAR